MNNKQLSSAQMNVLNIAGCIIVVAINTLIQLFLSPFIVKYLGVEMNGYITLANNMVSYCALITTALNSMAGRFILVSLRKNDIVKANEYYTSVWAGNWIICFVLSVPCIVFLLRIDKFINVLEGETHSIRILFLLVFLNFFMGLLIPQWSTATYVKNKLYLRSLKSVCSAIIRAVTIVALFWVCEPAAYFVGVAGLLMTITNIIFEFIFKRTLAPELVVKKQYFKFVRIRELLASGIWNSISKCGNILLEGLDVLVANIFISPVAMGVLSLSKVIPNMMNQVLGNVSTTFGPQLVHYMAKDEYDKMEYEVKKNIRTLSILTTIPVGVTVIFGRDFFELWVPTQDSKQLACLTGLTLLGTLVTGITHGFTTIFGVVNKLRFNSIVVILSGVVNVMLVYILLRSTSGGVYIIAGVSSVITIIREFVFTVPYSAKCMHVSPRTLVSSLLGGIGLVSVPIIIGYGVRYIVSYGSWMTFVLGTAITCIAAFAIEIFIILNREERVQLIGKIMRFR